MNKKKSLQNNYRMKKTSYQRAHFARCNLLTSSKLFARRFNVWSSRQLSISLTRAKWLWARLRCWSLERQYKPCLEKMLNYWLYSTIERIWSTNRSFIIFCPKRTFFQGRGPIWILQKFHSRSIQHHDIFRFTLPWCLWVDCYPWVVSEASCRMPDLLHKKETALCWWTEDGYFLNETFVPKQQKPSKQAKSPSCKDIDQLQLLT